nr:alpha/beta hydrolase [Pseudonocardia pini]
MHERIAARSAGSRVVVVPGTGHLCHQEDPTATNAVIVEFLRP